MNESPPNPIGLKVSNVSFVAVCVWDYNSGMEMLRVFWGAAREIDPDADVQTVIERVKADGPTDFDGALAGYRESMLRARAHLIEHDLITVPDDERIDVIATPEYLRSVLPFAAYFQPAAFDAWGFLGEPTEELGAVGHLAPGLGQRLAHLQGHQQRDVLGPFDQQLEGPAEDLAALAGVGGGPVGLRGDGRVQRGDPVGR